MKLLYFGIYSKGKEYPRNNNIIRALRYHGVNVAEAHVEIAETFNKRMAVLNRPAKLLRFGIEILISYLALSWEFIRHTPVDAVIVGNPGYFHVHLAHRLKQLFCRKALLIYDVFIPLYEAIAEDRKLISPHSRTGWMLKQFEKSCCRQADLILIDTNVHAKYLADTFNLPEKKILRLFVGSTIGRQKKVSIPKHSKKFSVLFVGTYIPLHGIDVILSAARILRGHREIQFVLVGTGQLRRKIEAQAREWELSNVSFKDWIPSAQLGPYIQTFDLSLGIFGTTPKTARVIPSKIFDICASGVPFVTSDSPAIREVFSHKKNAYLIPPGNPKALAKAILELKQNQKLRKSIAEGSSRLGSGVFSQKRLIKDLFESLHSIK